MSMNLSLRCSAIITTFPHIRRVNIAHWRRINEDLARMRNGNDVKEKADRKLRTWLGQRLGMATALFFTLDTRRAARPSFRFTFSFTIVTPPTLDSTVKVNAPRRRPDPPPTLRLPAAAPALPTSTGTAHICDTWTSQAAHTIPTVPSPAPGAGHLGLPARCHTGPLIDPHATTSSCYRCCARSGQSSYRTSLLALRLPHHKAIHAHVISFSPPRARQTGTGRSR